MRGFWVQVDGQKRGNQNIYIYIYINDSGRGVQIGERKKLKSKMKNKKIKKLGFKRYKWVKKIKCSWN